MDRIDELMKNYGISKEDAEVIIETEKIRGYHYERALALVTVVKALECLANLTYREAADMKKFVEERMKKMYNGDR